MKQWERCGCTEKCLRMKRRSEEKVQESSPNAGGYIAKEIPARRYSHDSIKNDLLVSKCRIVSLGGPQKLTKFIKPKNT